MKIGKYNLNKHTPSSLYHRHIRPLWDERLRGKSAWQRRFLVLTNNFCNLSCWSCSALCNKPIGSNPFRQEKYITPLSNIERFLELIKDYRPKYWIRLSGGEVTLCPVNHVEHIADLSHLYGRNISLLTNGANMLGIDPHLFEFIHLDEHILNEKLIYQVADYFKSVGYKRYQILTTKVHRDLNIQRRGHVTEGLNCSAMMQAISLWRDTIYPCCVLPFLDGWNGNTKIRDSLLKAGWSIFNDDLVDTMDNYKDTLPEDAVYACTNQCWHNGPNKVYEPVSNPLRRIPI